MHPLQQTPSISANFVNTSQETETTPENVSFPQIAQIANSEEHPSTSLSLTTNEQCVKEFQFNAERETVDNSFWSKFREELGKKSVNQLFDNFLLTNWKPEKSYKHNFKLIQESITKNITKSRKNIKEEIFKQEDAILQYDTLVEVFLYTGLKLRAMNLVDTILELGHLNSLLSDPQLTDRAETVRKRDRKVCCINYQYNSVFTKVYLPYQEYLKKADDQKTLTEITALKSAIRSLRNGMTRYQKKTRDIQLIKKHLLFINECLLNLKNHQKISVRTNKNLFITSYQERESAQPPEKKRRILPAAATSLCTWQASTSTPLGIILAQPNTTTFYNASMQPLGILVQSNAPVLIQTSTCVSLDSAQPSVPFLHHALLQTQYASSSQQSSEDGQYQTIMPHLYSTSSADQSKQLENESASTQPQNEVSRSDSEIKFASLLNKMTGKDAYFYYEVNTSDSKKNKSIIVNSEKYYHSLIMLSALNAQTLLLKIKILAAELTQAEAKYDKTSIRGKLRKNFSAFINNHLTYERNIEISQDKRIHQLPEGMSLNYIKYSYFSNCRNIIKAKAALADTIIKYNEIANSDKNTLTESYFEFVNSLMAMNMLHNSYFLSRQKMNQMLQSVLNMSSISNSAQEKFTTLRFQIDRHPVNDLFWQALKDENITEAEFKRYYFRFIFTSWRSSPDEIYQLDKAIKEAIDNRLDLQLRVNLVEKHFQEKLRYQAFHLIHHILLLIGKCQKLKNLPPSKVGMRKIVREQELSLSKIKENYQKTLMVHSDYLAARKAIDNVDLQNLYDEIKTCQGYVHNNTKVDGENAKQYILLINKILDNLEQDGSFSYSLLLNPINDYINNDMICETVTSKEYTPKQPQFLPRLSGEEPSLQALSLPQLQFAPTLNDKLRSAQFLSPDEALQSVSASVVEPSPFLSPLDFSGLDDPSSLQISPRSSELQLEPFLNFEQPVESIDTPYNIISFPPALVVSQQVTNVVEGICVQNDQQALKSSIELEQEQILEQQMGYTTEVNTLDFLNK